ncbi:MAG: restriction endonuclease subunit S [Marinilabiliaceae bacterium]|nr:restriction endonuclease subunit S [Marinilabiliaceae bacterium]
MKKYEKYKDSGIEWLGIIPEHWTQVRLKHIGESITGITYSPDDIVEQNSNSKLVLRSSNIQQGKLTLDNNVFVEKNIAHKYIIQKGDILLCSRNGSRDLIGKNILIDARTEGETWGAFMTVYRTQYYKFIYYFFNSQIFKALSSLFLSSTINQLTIGVLNDFIIAMPNNLPEQTTIAAFLDYKTAQIDALIEKKEQLIEKLKLKRQAIINEAVTKGLNPNAKMKDSGIEWLGVIPEHWEVTPLKYLVHSKRGIQTGPFGTQLNTNDYVEHGIKVINQKTLIDEDYNIGEEYISQDKMNELDGFEVFSGDIVMGTRGSFGTNNRTTFGKCSIVPANIQDSVLHPCLIRIRLDENLMNKSFFKFYINDSTHFLEFIVSTSNSTTIEVIYGVTLKNIKFPVPPLNEQKKIAHFITKKTEGIDNVSFKLIAQIEKLKLYRQSLISEAVTGKIDVRDWQKPEQNY